MSVAPVPETRHKAVWMARRGASLLFALLLGSTSALAAGSHRGGIPTVAPGAPNSQAHRGKLDKELTRRSTKGGTSKVIVTLQPGAKLPPEFAVYAKRNGRLNVINGHVLQVPNNVLKRFAQHPSVFKIDFDRPISRLNYRTSVTVGAPAVHSGYGLTGAGVGVAIIDSGITNWHDDLTSRTGDTYPYGNQRVAAFVDFVNGATQPYDDDGHGTHVAGIIAGNGYDSNGNKAGIAPDATLVSLKVLDANGGGTISNIIAAFDWVVAHHTEYNIRVVNASVGAAIHESYWTDPLTLAAKRVVDAGVVVVGAAGNVGKNALGETQYGGITAPGNAPWVLTVGASSTNGTVDRSDDTIASFSSRGPTYKDWGAKPDLVAPGVGTVSLANPQSNFYLTKAPLLVDGTLPTAFKPYLTLSGTSMAAPVVTGTVALMMQANPSLTPNMAKAILQYTAQTYDGYNPLTQGAGFLNTFGAVRLASFYATAQPGDVAPVQAMWSKHLIWGNHMISGGFIKPSSNAYTVGVNWGVAKTDNGDKIVWGTDCGSADCDNIVWGTADGDNIVWGTADDGDNIVWGTGDDDNIVWGTDCGGADCDNIVWGTSDGDNIVWGTADAGDNIVWGTACQSSGCDDDNIVWGTADDGDNIVWGTSDDGDNIVWGTSEGDGDNIVWGTSDDGDNIVWGTTFDGTTYWFNGATNVIRGNLQGLVRTRSDSQIFAVLVQLAAGAPAVVPVPPTTDPAPPDTTSPTTDPAPTTDSTATTDAATTTTTGATTTDPTTTTDPVTTTDSATTNTTTTTDPTTSTAPTAPATTTGTTTTLTGSVTTTIGGGL